MAGLEDRDGLSRCGRGPFDFFDSCCTIVNSPSSCSWNVFVRRVELEDITDAVDDAEEEEEDEVEEGVDMVGEVVSSSKCILSSVVVGVVVPDFLNVLSGVLINS